jgi:hypothetical protein
MDVRNPFFWTSLSGLFAGAALSGLRLFARRERKGSSVSAPLFATAAVAAAAAGFFLAGAEAFLHPPVLYFLGAALVLGFFSLSFKRAVGIPLLIILGCMAFLSALALSPWKPVAGTVAIVSIRPLSQVNPSGFSYEIGVGSEEPKFALLSEGDLAVPVEVLSFPEWYFFLSARHFYRCIGGTLCDTVSGDGEGGDPSWALLFPGARSERLSAAPVQPILLEAWVLQISENGEFSWMREEEKKMVQE